MILPADYTNYWGIVAIAFFVALVVIGGVVIWELNEIRRKI